MPHFEQFFASVLRFTSQPLAAFMSQSANPWLQTPTPHTALTHEAAALGGIGQVLPQPPQFIGSVAMLTSQPVFGSMSQSENPGAQLMIAHAPLVHACTLLAP